MISALPIRLFGLLSLVATAGCVGSNEDPGPTDLGFLDPAATGSVAIAAASLDSAARSTDGLSGSIDNDSGTFSLGGLSGTLSDDNDSVALDGGGQVVLTFDDTEFAVLFDATPIGEDRTVGVVGLPTDATDVPDTGRVSYTGLATVTIQDDTAVYELTGQATIDADFDGGTVTSSLTDLSGTETISLNEPNDVTDVATISFTGSTISSATFSDGTPTLDSTIVSSLSGSETSDLDGGFYGPGADEAGAVFIIDDSIDGAVTVFGSVIAD